jgi:hypothetical protein
MELEEIKRRIDLLDSTKNKIRVASYNPLCYTKTGERAYMDNNLNPFIDASCRREPDLENRFPSITAICRKNKFAPNLKEGDIVVYITNKWKYLKDERANNKLVAVLQVIKKCSSHQVAADWYKERDESVPSNCFVDGNNPFPFTMTGGLFKDKNKDLKYYERQYLKISITDPIEKERYENATLRSWDGYYRDIATNKKSKNYYPDFLITEKLIDCLDEPITIEADDFKKHFDRVANSRLPFQIDKEHLYELAGLMFSQAK